ncbi:hypothetical protein WA026_009788 [Henosepilachna vigintioctopunctata]|uniref:Uncharacterized protein n=1 Tax=Henosepilachna vigintioctopunctata TaxID=420089 RepID=A0AAW1TSU4_9CUCU
MMANYKKKLIQTKDQDEEEYYPKLTEIVYEKSVQCIPQEYYHHNHLNEFEFLQSNTLNGEIIQEGETYTRNFDRRLLNQILNSDNYEEYQEPEFFMTDPGNKRNRKVTTHTSEMESYTFDRYADSTQDGAKLSEAHSNRQSPLQISLNGKNRPRNYETDSNFQGHLWPSDRVQSLPINPDDPIALSNQRNLSRIRGSTHSCPLCSTEIKRGKDRKHRAKNSIPGHVTLQSSLNSAKNMYTNAVSVYERLRERPIMLLIVFLVFLYLTSH